MHPIEQLRYLARARGMGATELAVDAAEALAAVAYQPEMLLTAGRRLLDAHPYCGPLWWMVARVLVADDPVAEAERSASELEGDPTAGLLAAVLPPGAVVVATGVDDVLTEALELREDCALRVVGDRRRLRQAVLAAMRRVDDVTCWPRDELADALGDASMAMVEACAIGRSGLIASGGTGAGSGSAGSSAHSGASAAGAGSALAGARRAGVPVWATAGIGRALPDRLFAELAARVAAGGGRPPEGAEPTASPEPVELFELERIDVVVGPGGRCEPRAAAAAATCPAPPELLGWIA
jgi:hypothetical protein